VRGRIFPDEVRSRPVSSLSHYSPDNWISVSGSFIGKLPYYTEVGFGGILFHVLMRVTCLFDVLLCNNIASQTFNPSSFSRTKNPTFNFSQ